MKKSLFFSAVLSTLFYVNDSFAASRTYSEEYFDTKVPAAIKALGITYRDWVSKTATGTDYDFALSEDDWAHPANQYFAHSTREEQLSDLAGTPIQYGTPFLGNAGFEALFSSWTVLFGGEDIVRKSIMAHQQQISAQEERLADLQGRLTTSTAEKKRLEDQQDALGKLLSIKSENVSASLEALVSTGAIGGRKLTTLESYKAILGLSDYRDETIDTVTVRVRRESENLAGLTADIVLLEKSIGDQVKLIRGNKASLLEEEKRLRTL
ncbi:MAG: hypothetical protein FJZ62_06375, partial [Chlamydiae bacterium]|nr:hypothetical protein [Chlamydiota bacterium]